MKRVNNLYHNVCNLRNIEEADKNARLGKLKRYGVRKYDLNREQNNLKILDMLKNHTYETSEYDTFKIYEPKERTIFRLPYFPDRII